MEGELCGDDILSVMGGYVSNATLMNMNVCQGVDDGYYNTRLLKEQNGVFAVL